MEKILNDKKKESKNDKKMTEHEYRSHEALSQSNIKDWLTMTPAAWKRSLETPKEASEAMMFGTALHTAILEPVEFDKQYVVSDWYSFYEEYTGDDKPKTTRRAGKLYDRWKVLFEAKAANRTIIAEEGKFFRGN